MDISLLTHKNDGIKAPSTPTEERRRSSSSTERAHSVGIDRFSLSENEDIPHSPVQIGNGEHAFIYAHENPSFVVKIEKVPSRDFSNEAEIGALLDFPHFPKVSAIYERRSFSKQRPQVVAIVMEKVQGSPILRKRGLEKPLIIKLLNQGMECSKYLYEHSITWGDLNPGNIMITSETKDLKIIDFGSWKANSVVVGNFKFQLFLGAEQFVDSLISKSTVTKDYPLYKRPPELFDSLPFTSYQKTLSFFEALPDSEVLPFMESYFKAVISYFTKNCP